MISDAIIGGNMKVLLIDDMRTFETEKIKNLNLTSFTTRLIAKTYREGIKELDKMGWDILLLDHDLGEEKDGMDILSWIEEKALDTQNIVPIKIIIVSDNAAEIKTMENLANKLTNYNEMNKLREKLKNGADIPTFKKT